MNFIDSYEYDQGTESIPFELSSMIFNSCDSTKDIINCLGPGYFGLRLITSSFVARSSRCARGPLKYARARVQA